MTLFYEDMKYIEDEIMNFIEEELKKVSKYEDHIEKWVDYHTDQALCETVRNLSKSSIIKKY